MKQLFEKTKENRMDDRGKGKKVLKYSGQIMLGAIVLWLLGYAVYVFAVI